MTKIELLTKFKKMNHCPGREANGCMPEICYDCPFCYDTLWCVIDKWIMEEEEKNRTKGTAIEGKVEDNEL